MDLADLRYLSITVETGSLLHAAQSLGVKPSTISRRITRLEDELGVTIFERGSFGMRLTPAGRDVMVQVRRSLDAIDNVIRPKLVGKDAKMPDLLILVGTLGGLLVFGPIGFIIGPLICGLFLTVWEIYGATFKEILPPVHEVRLRKTKHATEELDSKSEK